MNITLHFILAHFLADYPLQSSRLAKYKQNHFTGVLIHSLTHFLASVALLVPFLYEPKVWIAIGIIFVQHNILDQTKISLGKRYPKTNKFMFYVLDQAGHMLIIAWVGIYYLGTIQPKQIFGFGFFSANSMITFLLALTLATYFYDVSRWTYLNSIKKQPYVRNYKTMGRNAVIVVIAFALYWVSNR